MKKMALINKFFHKFNFEINRIHGDYKWDNFTSQDIKEFNSVENTDKWYDLEKHIEDYLSGDRMSFYNQLIDLCLKQGIIFNNTKIIDVGCGSGAFLNEIKKRFSCNLMGADHSKSAIKYAKKKFNDILFQVKNIEEINEKYNVVFCIEVLEHLNNPSIALKKLLTLMAGGGILILTVPDGRKDTFIGHINFWSPESWPVFLNDNCLDYKINTLLIDHTNVAFIKTPRF